jgi:hypothetical protein
MQSIPSHPVSLRSILIFPPTYVLIFLVVSFLLAFPPISIYQTALRATTNKNMTIINK